LAAAGNASPQTASATVTRIARSVRREAEALCPERAGPPDRRLTGFREPVIDAIGFLIRRTPSSLCFAMPAAADVR
jgi:hypothetical protein